MRHKRSFSWLYVILVLFIIYLPVAVVVLFSFNSSKAGIWSSFTTDWYVKLFRNEALITAFQNSLLIAVLSASLAAILGTLGAIGMAKSTLKSKGAIEGLTNVPIMIPEIILGLAYLVFFKAAHIPFGMVALVLAHTTFCIPYIYINVKSRLAGMDKSIEEAALDLGASHTRVLFDITLPLIFPAILSGVLLAFAMSMDDVVISFFVTSPTTNTLPIKIYSMLKMGVSPEINALQALMLGAVLFIILIFRLIKRKYRVK